MRKILFIIVILVISTKVFADCAPFNRAECPKTACPSDTFMGNDGKCYSCDTDKSVDVDCIGYEKAFEICPNRFFEAACTLYSKLKCFDEELVEEIIKEDDLEKEVFLRNGDYYRVNYVTHDCNNLSIMY